jgi:hypothetical protein
MAGTNSTSLTAQDYIDTITGGTPGFAPLDAPPPPDQPPVSFDDRRNLALALRKVSDAGAEMMRPVSDSRTHWCNHCTHRLTDTFHMSSSLPGFMTNSFHFTKRRENLAAAIAALPEGNEKSLAKAFEKAATYAYCLQEARIATKPGIQSALIDLAAKAAGALPDKAEDLKIECAAGTGDFSAHDVLYNRLYPLQDDLKTQLTAKIEDLKTSNAGNAAVAPPAPVLIVSTPQPLQVGKPITFVKKNQTP